MAGWLALVLLPACKNGSLTVGERALWGQLGTGPWAHTFQWGRQPVTEHTGDKYRRATRGVREGLTGQVGGEAGKAPVPQTWQSSAGSEDLGLK